ncbi:MAG: serine acetyltransferase [Bacteroidetes bacterium HGW-Bacteroidetes-15]|nr:MAG: serine acetyltransferase [Bacteroidetes bacterium HGW-Bacteroidetes-15]
MKDINQRKLPPKPKVIEFTKNLGFALFPNIEGGKGKIVTSKKLQKQLRKLIKPFDEGFALNVDEVVKNYIDAIPIIRNQLQADAAFIEANDPATTCIEEVIMAYPGFYAIMVYRLANKLKGLGVPLIPRIMTEHAHSLTGIDIHPGATIGNEFFIDHGTGIVIGESATIGDRVKMYQGVTLGAMSVCKDTAQSKRHPNIESDVVIYAGATILGGKTIIGHHSVIGGNVWLTNSVPPYSTVQHEDGVKVKQRKFSLN